jgi:LmbE family N-acetylglucosaminyl deacetylase
MYFPDGFQKPNPFHPDVIVAIDDVLEKKMDAVDALVSQVYEGGALGSEETLRQRHADNPIARREWATGSWQKRQSRIADKYREALIHWYGEEAGREVKYAEAFEVCEYGRQPTHEELKTLFPFFGE